MNAFEREVCLQMPAMIFAVIDAGFHFFFEKLPRRPISVHQRLIAAFFVALREVHPTDTVGLCAN